MSDMESDRADDRRSIIRIVLAELTLVLLIFAGVAAVIRGASPPDPADAASAAASPRLLIE